MATQTFKQILSSISSATVVDVAGAVSLTTLAAVPFGLMCLSRSESVGLADTVGPSICVKRSETHYDNTVLIFQVIPLSSNFRLQC